MRILHTADWHIGQLFHEYDRTYEHQQFLNPKTYDAVLMNFVIIAEACNRISPDLQTQHPEITGQDVRRFRNYIAHDYFGVDIDMVWQSLNTDLPKLKTGLQKIIENK
ncbi:HepT-like ribonuclease domain-containing protein [Parafilimonas sp.]|uniref:HepT-like ribonuclease domain-containing protein n=1 Tax=Parafilimonas sp. TaxID=1969739 RepID=UPI0039E5AFC3